MYAKATDVPHQPEDSENRCNVFCDIGLLIMDCRADGLLRSSQGAKRRAAPTVAPVCTLRVQCREDVRTVTLGPSETDWDDPDVTPK